MFSWYVCWVLLCFGAVGVVMMSGCGLFFPLWGEFRVFVAGCLVVWFYGWSVYLGPLRVVGF